MCNGKECTHPDDPSYDGFRMEELWLLSAIEESTDQEGILHQMVGNRLEPAMAADEARLNSLRENINSMPIGTKVRILHLKLESVEEAVSVGKQASN